MKFCWATILVSNMEKSLDFYRNILGLDLVRRTSPNPDMELAFLGKGETQIELICHQGNPITPFSQNISLGFSLPSLEDFIQEMKNTGICLFSGPFQPNPHIRFAYIKDPDGLKIQLVQHMDRM